MSALKLPVDPLQERMVTASVISEDQAEILADVLAGVSSEDLAAKFFLSEAGISFRIQKIYRAFKVKSRLELIGLAASEGLHFSIRGHESSKKLVFCVRMKTESREF